MTRIENVSMEKLLSADKTKQDLTEYLSGKVLQYGKDVDKILYVSCDGKTQSNKKQEPVSMNNHEGADTLMIYHAVCASRMYPNAEEICIFSPDTDVLIIAISKYPKLAANIYLNMKSGKVPVEPIYEALGPYKSAALIGFHAFTGCDNVGKFAGKGKGLWFGKFLAADEDTLQAFVDLGNVGDLDNQTKSQLAAFVCQDYCPSGVNISDLGDLRWHLFCKHMAESERLPPTSAALDQHILRAHHQASIWSQSDKRMQVDVNPSLNGWKQTDSGYFPVTTILPAAPKGVTELVKCACKTNRCESRCSCKSQSLTCTELCACVDCDNDEPKCVIEEDDDDSNY